jgi:hypothetical protein
MNILRNIEKSFIGHIENKSNTDVLKKLIQSYFDNKKTDDDILNQKYNKYVALFENERINNNLEYDAYLSERKDLYNTWKTNKNKSALMDLIKLQRPARKEIADIYTYSVLNLHDSTKPKVAKPNVIKPLAKPLAKPKEKPPIAKKECPEGKIINPKTGRCVNDPDNKKGKPDKPDKPEPEKPKKAEDTKNVDKPEPEKPKKAEDTKNVDKTEPEKPKKAEDTKNVDKPEPEKPKKAKPVVEKKCPEGKILNPQTGRCINDPNIKKAKKPKAQE